MMPSELVDQSVIILSYLQLRRKRRHRSPVSDVEKVMIWNEYEAYVVQVKQIGTSACGPTAVLNVLVSWLSFHMSRQAKILRIKL